MRLPFFIVMTLASLSGGAVRAATSVGTLGVSAVVVERCTIVVREAQTAETRCDRGMVHRIERRAIVDPADGRSRTMGTVVTY